LSGGREERSGTWRYKADGDKNKGHLFATPQGGREEQVGVFEYEAIENAETFFTPVFDWDKDPAPSMSLPIIEVVNGEVMQNIQDLDKAAHAYFVLPSQLNGAEYPSEVDIVQDVQEYVYDNTGGPRGQLAVHPAAGAFVLANAACDRNGNAGINAVDVLLKEVPEVGLKNGYMKLPQTDANGARGAKQIFDKFVRQLHTLRPLIMHDVPANGLRPSKSEWSTAPHKVGLVYASAVPVDSYLNEARNDVEERLHSKMAEAVLVAQYFGAMQRISLYAEAQGWKDVKVYLLPLGGGVFNNSWESIARAMAQAVELMVNSNSQGLDRLQVKALAWSGNPKEKDQLSSLLKKYGKLGRTGRPDAGSGGVFCCCMQPQGSFNRAEQA